MDRSVVRCRLSLLESSPFPSNRLFLLFQGSRDNMTMLIVGLDSVPTPDPEMTKLDKELNTAIREMIESELSGVL